MIWGILLAAGESKRMGKAKLLLPYGKKTILETVLGNILASHVDRVMVVLGSRWRKIKSVLKGYDVQMVINRRFREGMLSSIQEGIAALPPSSQAAVIVLADQPSVPAKVIDALIDAYGRGKKGLVVPVYRKKRGHPLLVDLRYRQEIMALDPEIGLRQLLKNHPGDILEVTVSVSSVLRDIDDPGDYERAQAGKSRPDPKRV